LVKAIINEARSRYQQRKRIDGRPIGLLEDPSQTDYRHELVEVVSMLPPRQRAATFLVYWEGHTSVSAAELMGCRPATVRRYLHLAHRKLEEMIDERD
jgi:DNA-directed RNA polymerase specialized sigma24 family protein